MLMKKLQILLALAVAILGSAANLDAAKIKMSKETLLDKVKGGWAGQTIGCTYGGPTEFKWKGEMIPDGQEIIWNEGRIKHYFDHGPGLYDDVYMDLTFVKVFAEKGLDANIDDFAQAFAYSPYPLWHANLQARVNIFRGLKGRDIGYWENNPHADDIDFQIEADYAGLMAPAMPNAAAFYCDDIGHIMNYGDGWYGGVYVAAMYALAFQYDDIHTIVKEALKTLPEQSRYYRCIADVIRWYEENPSDWKACWAKCQEKYTDEVDCPDEPGSEFRIDAVINGAYIAIGLLFGEGDYFKTMDISTRCGQDSDCNPASAIGILSTMIGYSNIPQEYLAACHLVEDRPFSCVDLSLNQTYELSYNQALEVIKRNGGKVGKDDVVIKVQKPKAVRFEQSFPGYSYKETIGIDKHLKDGACAEFTFEGNAVIVKGRLRNRQKDSKYEANVRIVLDGKEYTEIAGEDSYQYQDHIFHKYELAPGKHTVKISVDNVRNDKLLWVDKALVYAK